MKTTTLIFALTITVLCLPAVAADNVPETALANMPVKEVTIFKDGHVFVLHQAKAKTDSQGNVVLDYLPRPILGTFWAYSNDSKAALAGVVAGKRVVSVDRTALNIPELIEANIGAKVRISEIGLDAYECTILDIPTRSSDELARTSPPGAGERLPQRGSVVLLQFEGGVKAVPIERIKEVTFIHKPAPKLPREEFRNIMTLKLDWNNGKPQKTAEVGMVYVQRGIRWIPNYRIDIDGEGNAVVKLQATLINELADVQNVKAHLVIGVPRFVFEKTPDPISLQDTVARLSRVFRRDSQTGMFLSNAIMTQVGGTIGPASRGGDEINLGSDIAESGKNEDLYVFTLDHITLKKGQRMVVPVAEYKLKYTDVYTLDLPFEPPPEVRHRFKDSQREKLARLFAAPKVMHKIRIENSANAPLTTAPVLIFRSGRIIAQSMMTYTPAGASNDIELTTAVDISVKMLDTESSRTPNAQKLDNHSYARTSLTGVIHLTNRRSGPVNLEIRRSVLGHIDSANRKGVIEHLGRHESGWNEGGLPEWWHWYSWPQWWYHLNAVARVTWEIELKPSKSVDLEYKWNYFWRQ